MTSTSSAGPTSPRAQSPRPKAGSEAPRALHEWPLAVFTACAIGASGTFVSLAILRAGPEVARSAMPGAGLVLALGLLVSLAHLGRPWRSVLALRRTGRSVLSTEVALASVLVGLAVAPILLPPALHLAAARAAALVSLALLASIGFVYFLPARRPWRGALVASPLLSGLAIGATALAAAGAGPWVSTTACFLLGVDLAAFVAAWAAAATTPGAWLPAHPAFFAHRTQFLTARIAVLDLVPAGLLLAKQPLPGLAVAFVGLLLDRVAFYALAEIASTEAELMSVERAMDQLEGFER